MTDREDKVQQIVKFVKKHPESFATRTMMRKFLGTNWEITNTDFEISEEIIQHFTRKISDPKIDEYELDACYDLVK